jgi:hypothetical protein
MTEHPHYSTWFWVSDCSVVNTKQMAVPDTLMQADAMPCRLRASRSIMKRSPNANTETKQNITILNKIELFFKCSFYCNKVFPWTNVGDTGSP